MSDYARQERASLAAALAEAGPDAPTLCEGWTTADLAAHVVVRERRVDAAAGALLPPLASHGERVRKDKAAEPYARVLAELRDPPWWSPVSNPLVHEQANTMEFFIHHEDVRRAGPQWEPRELADGEQRALWGAVKLLGRITLRKLPVPVLLRAPGFGELSVGGGTPQATITGEPGELALFASGRQRAARVVIDADDATAERLRTSALSL